MTSPPSLTVLGAGFGRTGTLSLKLALEQLGFGPCHHMHEVLARPAHAEQWRAAQRDGQADWNTLLAGYGAAVDWPAAYFWRQLSAHYSQARVILTVRDPQAWYESVRRTLFPAQCLPLPDPDAPAYASAVMPRELIRYATFDDRLDDSAHVIGVYQAHNRAVQAALPPARLLVYDVTQGWAPLCAFLGAAVPDAPFPASNSTADFLARVQKRP